MRDQEEKAKAFKKKQGKTSRAEATLAGIGLLSLPLVHGFGGSLSANRRIFGRMFHSLPKTGA